MAAATSFSSRSCSVPRQVHPLAILSAAQISQFPLPSLPHLQVAWSLPGSLPKELLAPLLSSLRSFCCDHIVLLRLVPPQSLVTGSRVPLIQTLPFTWSQGLGTPGSLFSLIFCILSPSPVLQHHWLNAQSAPGPLHVVFPLPGALRTLFLTLHRIHWPAPFPQSPAWDPFLQS